MPLTLPAPPDNPPAIEQPACDCPTHTTPGTRHDAITTVHMPTCHLYRRGDPTTRRYVPGTLDQLLGEQFGPPVAPDLYAAVMAERFGSVTA